MKKGENFIIAFILIASLAYFKFFRPIGVSDVILKLIYYIFLGIIMISSFKEFLIKKNTGYSRYMSLLIYIIPISIFSAYAFWEQSPILTFVSSFGFFSFFFFFFFKKHKIPIEVIEKIVWIFSIIFTICFIYAFLKAPNKVFTGYGGADDIDDSRGLFRIRLTIIGAGPIYLAYFMALSKYMASGFKKWLVYALILLAIIALQLGRQAILLTSILGFLYVFKKASFLKKIAVIAVFTGVIWYSFTQIPFIAKLVEVSQAQVERTEDDDDVRVKAYSFYMIEMPTNVFTGIFGKGMYTLQRGNYYGDYINTNGRDKGLIPADVGYAFIYLLFGVSGLLLFFLILIKAVFQKIPEEYMYLKYYIYFLMLGNIAGSPLIGTIPTFCMAVYILYVLNNNKKIAISYEKN
tara:strand:- start:9213 stop:10430 length:1218 start_codon:yes stop_codon:yes gene_type:complete